MKWLLEILIYHPYSMVLSVTFLNEQLDECTICISIARFVNNIRVHVCLGMFPMLFLSLVLKDLSTISLSSVWPSSVWPLIRKFAPIARSPTLNNKETRHPIIDCLPAFKSARWLWRNCQILFRAGSLHENVMHA